MQIAIKTGPQSEDNTNGKGSGPRESENAIPPGMYYEKSEESEEDYDNWNKFKQDKFSATSVSEQNTNLIKRGAIFLKCLTILVTTSVVLVGGVVSKGLVVLMLAQIKPPTQSERLCVVINLVQFQYNFTTRLKF